MREAARFWHITPETFRALPRREQIEMMAHRREVRLRESHAETVRTAVNKIRADEDKREGSA